MRIDLNADLGESFGIYTLGQDPGLLPAITSANIACGFHAGDPSVMRATVRLAVRHGVAIGAHPGFQDLAGFGRREMRMSPSDVQDMVTYQIGALAAIARSEGQRLQHVKPHGALYNMAARDRALAEAIAVAVHSVDPSLILFGLSSSALLEAGVSAGLRVASEVFADRAYMNDGSLAPRSLPHAIVNDPDAVVARVVMMAREGAVIATDGSRVSLKADTICVHGDTPGAAMLATRIRRALRDAGIDVHAF